MDRLCIQKKYLFLIYLLGFLHVNYHDMKFTWAVPKIKVITQSRLIQRKIFRNEQGKIWIQASLLGDQGEVLAGVPIKIYCRQEQNQDKSTIHNKESSHVLVAQTKTSFDGMIKVEIPQQCPHWPSLHLWSWDTQTFSLQVDVEDSSSSRGFTDHLNFELIQQDTVLRWNDYEISWNQGRPKLSVSIHAHSKDEEFVYAKVNVRLYSCTDRLKNTNMNQSILQQIKKMTPIESIEYQLQPNKIISFKIPQSGCYWLTSNMNHSWRHVKGLYKKLWVKVDVNISLPKDLRLYIGRQSINESLEFQSIHPNWNPKGLTIFNQYQSYKLPRSILISSQVNSVHKANQSTQILCQAETEWQVGQEWTQSLSIPNHSNPVFLQVKMKENQYFNAIHFKSDLLALKTRDLMFKAWWMIPVILLVLLVLYNRSRMMDYDQTKVIATVPNDMMTFQYKKKQTHSSLSTSHYDPYSSIKIFDAATHQVIPAQLFVIKQPAKFADWSILRLTPPKSSIEYQQDIHHATTKQNFTQWFTTDHEYWLWVYAPQYEPCAILLSQEFIGANLSIPLWPIRYALLREAQQLLKSKDIPHTLGRDSFTLIRSSLTQKYSQKDIHDVLHDLLRDLEYTLYHAPAIEMETFIAMMSRLASQHTLTHFVACDIRNHWSILEYDTWTLQG